jgi:hypothetical protein
MPALERCSSGPHAGLLRTFAACSAPYSVKAKGRYFRCSPLPAAFKVAICDLKQSHSCRVSWNAKSTGKTIGISTQLLIEALRRHPINTGKIAVEDDLLPTNRFDAGLDILDRNCRCSPFHYLSPELNPRSPSVSSVHHVRVATTWAKRHVRSLFGFVIMDVQNCPRFKVTICDLKRCTHWAG